MGDCLYKKYLQNQYVHFLVLLLSIALHLGVGIAFGTSAHIEDSGGALRRESVTTVIELLSASGEVVETNPAIAVPKEVNDMVVFPESMRATLRDKKSTEFADNSVDLSQLHIQGDNNEVAILPMVMSSGAYYFSVDELTENPYVVIDISPDVNFSVPNGMSQLAILRLLITEAGDIDQVEIAGSSLPKETQRLMIDTFLKTKFQPGKINGVSVKSELEIEVVLGGYEIGKLNRDAGSTPVVIQKLE